MTIGKEFKEFMGRSPSRDITVGVVTLFAVLYHIPLWLVRGQSVSLMGCLWVVFFSLWVGYVLHQSRSLWTCIVIHALQNLLLAVQ